MCGISAIVNFDRDDPVLALRTMHQALAHRGPDGEGYLLVSPTLALETAFTGPQHATGPVRCAAGFRRLKIQDHSAVADQPFASTDKKLWLLFNGEIYNFEHLRDELQGMGHRFVTRSDTEVLLAAYEQWGAECVRKFEGMWAFLVLDLRQGKILGSRDRLGIKPLFLAYDGQRILIASEPQAIAMAQRAGPKIYGPQFRRFLQGQPPDSPNGTFYEGVRSIAAGTNFEISLRGDEFNAPVFSKYWDLDNFRPAANDSRSFDQMQEEFVALLKDSIFWKSKSDTDIGALLSGGLDTSVVTMLLSRMRDKPLKTFSIAFSDPRMSEKEHIDAVVKMAGAESCCLELSPENAFSSVDAVVCTQGQPLLGQDVIAQYLVYGLARASGVPVVLEGQGADEMLAGMPFYESFHMADLLRRLQLLQLYREVAYRASKYERSQLSVLRSTVVTPLRVRVYRRLGFPRYGWLDGRAASKSRTEPSYKDPSLLNRHLRRLFKELNLPTVLGYQDRSSMAHSVESRVPFLDHRLVEFCFRLPVSAKLDHGIRKKILYEAAKGVIPESVRQRNDKKTFISRPDWMPLNHHRAELSDMFASSRFKQMPFVDKAAARKFVKEHGEGHHRDTYGVWRLYTAWRWMELFRVN